MLLQFSGDSVTVFRDTLEDNVYKIRRNGESLYLNRKQKCLNLRWMIYILLDIMCVIRNPSDFVKNVFKGLIHHSNTKNINI